ncbi:GNAT family N-acetyltransferase [Virgibacillus kekensis]|uniref:GNAT family N-acetyltransferase n=1 Tax=Virgibacillus kekensis TaxID=202261 RepID=A0ABV9DP20_9BACI
MEVTIAKPSEHHTEGIASVCAAGWRQTVEGKLSVAYQEQNVEFWYNHQRVRDDIKAGNYSHVALHNLEVVGVAGGGMTGPKTGEVFVLYVDESCRYQGIGRQLLEALTDEQIELGANEQWVSVQEDNQYGIPFYEARGFIFQEKRITETETGEKQVSRRYLRKLRER